MKRYAIGAALLAVTSVSVHAQSSVTLYGVVDVGIAYVSKLSGSPAVKMLDGTSVPTQWGMTGTEDIGGGTRVIFRLENGFSASTGAQNNPNAFFNRQAWVGLTNSRFGTLTLGNESSLEFDVIAPLYSAEWTTVTDLMAHPGNFDDLYNSHQTNSSIKYRSPSLYGFEFGLLYGGLTGTPGNAAYARAYQAVGTYRIGDFAASAFYGSENHRSMLLQSGTGVTSFLGATITAAPFVADNVKNVAAGLRYAPNPFVFTALYTQTRVTYQGRSANFDNYDLAAGWQVTPFALLAAGFTQTHFDGGVMNTGALTVNYQLSKHTAIYADEIFQRASNGHVAAIATIGSAGAGSQNLSMVGMRHIF